MTKTNHRVLIVDDEVEVGKSLRRLLRRHFDAEVAVSGEEGLVKLESFRPDVVISDFRMPGMNGAAFLAEVRRRAPMTLRFILSGYADLDSVLASVNEGEICRFLKKPWNDDELVAMVGRMLESRLILAQLYEPFRTGQGISAEVAQDESRLLVSAKVSGEHFLAAEALSIIRKFAGVLEESQLEMVGGLLERHAGKLSFVAQVGGDSKLTLELPLSPASAKDEST